MIAGSQTIANDRRWSQKIEHGSIFCDHDRRIAEVCFHLIAELSAICDHMETSLNSTRDLILDPQNLENRVSSRVPWFKCPKFETLAFYQSEFSFFARLPSSTCFCCFWPRGSQNVVLSGLRFGPPKEVICWWTGSSAVGLNIENERFIVVCPRCR